MCQRKAKQLKYLKPKNDYFFTFQTPFVDSFVNSGNTMNESFQRTDTLFRIDQVNIVAMNILKSDMQHR